MTLTAAVNGVLEWFDVPCAVAHEGVTYFAYQKRASITDQLWINTITNGVLGTPVMLMQYAESYDDHGSPTICIIPTGPHAGKLLVAFAHHVSPGYTMRSANPYDITSWDAAVSFGATTSYPKLRMLDNGTIFMSYRLGTGGEVFRTSTDGGTSWSAYTTLISTTECYCFTFAEGSRIDAVFTWSSSTSRFHDGFHAYSPDYGMTWKKSDGTAISLPLTRSNMTQVFADDTTEPTWPGGTTTGEDSWIVDFKVHDGVPCVLWESDLYSVTGSPTLEMARFVGDSWVRETVLDPAPVFYSGMNVGTGNGRDIMYPCAASIDYTTPSRVITTYGQGTPAGTRTKAQTNMALLTKSGATWVAEALTTNPLNGAWFEARPQFVKGADECVWCHFTNYTTYHNWSSSLMWADVGAAPTLRYFSFMLDAAIPVAALGFGNTQSSGTSSAGVSAVSDGNTVSAGQVTPVLFAVGSGNTISEGKAEAQQMRFFSFMLDAPVPVEAAAQGDTLSSGAAMVSRPAAAAVGNTASSGSGYSVSPQPVSGAGNTLSIGQLRVRMREIHARPLRASSRITRPAVGASHVERPRVGSVKIQRPISD